MLQILRPSATSSLTRFYVEQLMAIETPTEYGGSGSSFTAAIIAIEELAKVDPSVSVLCDVHNTLVNTIFRTYGTEKQKERFLPALAEKSVSRSVFAPWNMGDVLTMLFC